MDGYVDKPKINHQGITVRYMRESNSHRALSVFIDAVLDQDRPVHLAHFQSKRLPDDPLIQHGYWGARYED